MLVLGGLALWMMVIIRMAVASLVVGGVAIAAGYRILAYGEADPDTIRSGQAGAFLQLAGRFPDDAEAQVRATIRERLDEIRPYSEERGSRNY